MAWHLDISTASCVIHGRDGRDAGPLQRRNCPAKPIRLAVGKLLASLILTAKTDVGNLENLRVGDRHDGGVAQ